MPWDPVWDKVFKERASWGRYPPEELVRFVATHFYRVADRSAVRMLDVGCGPGAGPSWYIAREGFALSGGDGSPTAIAEAKKFFASEGLRGDFNLVDLTALPWPDSFFDAVVDVACLQCNSEAEVRPIIGEIHRVLKPGGRHFSIVSAQGTLGDGIGRKIDGTTYSDIPEGPFAGLGKNRFATIESIRAAYADFTELEINYSIRSLGEGPNEVRNWVVTCAKQSSPKRR